MIYDFLAYCLIPALSLLFAQGTDWSATNFSVLRNGGNREFLFLAWGGTLIFSFFLWFRDMALRLSLPGSASLLVRAACASLAAAIMTPYLPERFPLWSRIHFACAFLSPVLFLSGLLLLLLSYRRENPVIARRFLLGFWSITLLSLIILLREGMVTSGLEILFSSACAVLLRRLHRRVMH